MKKKSSVFQGVSYDARHRSWVARIRAEKFHRRYETEMEAVAHYNAVAKKTWPERINPETGSPVFGTIINSPWDGRQNPAVGFVNKVCVIDINRHSFTSVDEKVYIKYKDFPWFVRDREVRTVSAATPVGLVDCYKWDFEYISLKECVWYLLKNEKVSGAKIAHKNGDYFDNRIANLISV